MKRKFFVKSLFVGTILSCSCLINTSAYATKIEIGKQEENKTLMPGDTIKIDVKISDIGIEDGINAIQGKLQYDKDVFEKVKNEDFETKNNWSIIYNDEDTEAEGKFVMVNLGEGVKEEQELTSVTLKVKDNTKTKDAKIELVELHTAEDDQIIDIDASETSVKVKSKFNIKSIFEGCIDWIRNLFNRK